MPQQITETPVLVYRAFLMFTAALIVWSAYSQYVALRMSLPMDIFEDQFWQFGIPVIWNGSFHAMSLLVALIALLFRSGAAAWLYALALTYSIVPKIIITLSEFSRTGLWSILLLGALLAHAGLVAWVLLYLIRTGQIRPPK